MTEDEQAAKFVQLKHSERAAYEEYERDIKRARASRAKHLETQLELGEFLENQYPLRLTTENLND